MTKPLPQYIYKYTTINKFLFETIIGGELWFSPPVQFNDPFDSSLPIDFSLESFKRTSGWETNSEMIAAQQSTIVQPMVFGNDLEKLRAQMGVSCFSTVYDNLIMWSHYADKHKGLILIFDVAELQKVFYTIRYVTYTDKIKRVDYESPANKLIEKLLTRKSTHWKSENEVRIIVKKAGNYSFPKTALRGIIFGLQCDHRQLSNLVSLVQKFGYTDAYFSQLRITNYEYKLEKSLITTSSEYKAYKGYGDKGQDEMLKQIESILGTPGIFNPLEAPKTTK